MIFSSNIFVYLFLPITLALYFFVYKATNKTTPLLNALLIFVSLFFYLWGNGEFTLIFLFSILINYFLGKIMFFSKRPKMVLFVGICINLSILFYFKYSHFFLSSFHAQLPSLSPLFLPIGISFYTFMAISYLCDIYRRKTTPVSLLRFSTYLSFFPHLVAGPIVRYQDIGKEIKERKVDSTIFYDGFLRFSFGLGKKVIIANNLGFVVDKIFSLAPSELSFVLAWVGILLYAFQIYYDFSGYTDMAIGLAQFFGFHFPENFNAPYRARSITEFWQRWHISLSSWFRDYLYIPLGGNRKGPLRTYINLLIVFLLCGLWHGAAWTFILWGGYHGVLLVIERYIKNTFHFVPKSRLWMFPTFILVMLGWVFFRSPSIAYALSYWKTLFTFNNIFFISRYYHLSYYVSNNVIFYCIIAAFFSFTRLPLKNNNVILGSLALALFVYSLSILAKTSFTPFIYFQF